MLSAWLLVAATPCLAVTADEALVQAGSHGSAAAQLDRITAVAADPTNGHIFAVDAGNNRIDEFTPWGEFVKAFGWDVAPGGVNEQQEITIKATAGQFKLTFGASSTGDLEHNATPAAVQTALNALTSVSTGGGGVTVKSGASDGSSSRYVVSFTAGPLKEADVAQLSAANGTVPLSGGTPSSSAVVSTRADGTPPGIELESCTTESGCQAGSAGAGQIAFAREIAVDPSGDVYVRNTFDTNKRVQKFDSAGRFLLMFGGEVNKTSGADICTKADEVAGDECGAGVPGVGAGEFEAGIGIAVGPGGEIFVADKERIQEFEPDGAFLASISVAGKTVGQLAVDPSNGDFYTTLTSPGLEPNVHKLNGSGIELCSFPVPKPSFVAIDPASNLYTVNVPGIGIMETLLEYEGVCPAVPPAAPISEFGLERPSQGVAALATNTAGDLLVGRSGAGVDFIQIYGPPPVKFEPPPVVAPEIGAQFLISADDRSATVKARIDPKFWADTSYFVEYGEGKCSEGGCTLKQPLAAAELGAGAVSKLVTTAGVELPKLEPKTTYHYRFVAQSTGGGPVRGVGGVVGVDGAEGTFKTLPPDVDPPPCPANQAFRVEASALLPDCRAYEMVSPVAKESGDTLALQNLSSFELRLNQAALDGESIAYSAYRAFPGAEAAPYTSMYIGRRGGGGWASEALAPVRGGAGVFDISGFLGNEFKAFTPDLCHSWLNFDAEPSPAPGGVNAFPNLYRRDGCLAPPHFAALTTVTPPGSLPKSFGNNDAAELQGYSADGMKAVFRAPWKMSADATAGGVFQVYEASAGGLSLVCILPNGTPLGSDCSAGSGTADFFINRGSSVSHAMSEDGSRIYWSAAAKGSAVGKVYVRVDGTETKKVSETQSTVNAHFWGASADGSAALFEVAEGANKEKLYLYSLEAESSTQVAGEVIGVAGASEDLSYVYFISREAIGGEGTAGKANLYLLHEGTKTLVATLAAADVRITGVNDETGAFSDAALEPIFHVARATPDGRHLAFISTNPLTGFDNTDANSGEADSEVFRYDVETEEVSCVSCSPVGANPQGRRVEVSGGAEVGGSAPWTAASIPAGENELYTPRAMSDDGNRVFFTAYTSLVPRDTNGKSDVYEWEAVGSGGCTQAKVAFSEENEGCVYLITTGKSEEDSELVDSTPTGGDVFFTTEESILPQDPGLIDIYDARVDGGFPPAPLPEPCDFGGKPCQPVSPTPGFQSPSPPAPEGNPPFKCPKGKHKVTKQGKPRCAKNKKKSPGKKSTKKGHKTGRASK